MGKQGKVLKEFGISSYIGQHQVLGINSKRLETVRALTSCQLLVTTECTLMELLKRAKEDGGHDEDEQQIEAQSNDKRASTASTKAKRKSYGPLIGRAMQCSLFHDERRHF